MRLILCLTAALTCCALLVPDKARGEDFSLTNINFEPHHEADTYEFAYEEFEKRMRKREINYNPHEAAIYDFEDDFLMRIPFSTEARNLYEYAKGDKDLLIKGLRGDVRNKGIRYTIPTLIPIMKHAETTLHAGETNRLSFESNVIPFRGPVKGFTLKGAVEENKARIFARYKIDLN